MSCTCNQSINCDPCAFCIPPGVTCLTTCEPVDPCPEKINMDCVIYSGSDHTCSDISNGESISPIIMQALSLIFPIEECCYFEATVVLIDPPPSEYTFCYVLDDGTCGRVCECDSTTSNVKVYSLDNPLIVGSLVYSDQNLSILAPEGWYGATGQCITIAGGTSSIYVSGIEGTVQAITNCVAPTTTAAPTTTLAPCYCYSIFMITTSTVSYVDCSGVSQVTSSRPAGTTFSLCAESIVSSVAYSVALPTQYCADRLNCPTTTTTTTATPTTTTTTTPPCNCILFENSGKQASISYKDCLGKLHTETISGALDPSEPVSLTRCGSSGASSSVNVRIEEGDACIGTGLSASCDIVPTTTIPCSQFILQCCKNDTATPIIIQPCYPNVTVPLAVGNVYLDDQSRYWVVMGTTGTPNNTYSPAWLTYYQSYSSASLALSACKDTALNQTALCPGITTTQGPAIPYLFYFSSVSCTGSCYGTSGTVYYSRCATLVSGGTCRLYTDITCLIPVAVAGYYSNGTTCYSVNSSGYVGSINLCSNFTTTTTSTSTSTLFTKTLQVNNQLSSSYGNIKITNFGSILGTAIQPIPTATWTSGPATNPGGTSNGVYTLIAGFTQLGIELTPTIVASFNYTVYIHVIVNGTQIECIPVPYSSTSQTIITSSHSYVTGDSIVVTLNRTTC